MIGKTIGHYHITEKIGEGGMGAVYKADDTTLPRTVAVKVLAGHLADNPNARQRFIREAEAASSLNHPNITTVYDLLKEGDEHYLCLEYVDGQTVKDIAREGPLDPTSAAKIVVQVAHALNQAHNSGILHRDIKSSNIMVTEEGRVKLLDFGLVHFDERSQLTQSGTTLGTLAYSSPEQITGSGFDQRSDLFSLGIVFYELLTGRLPFQGDSEAEVIYSILNRDPAKPSESVTSLSADWDRVLQRMLDKEPDSRYQNAQELAEEIATVLGIDVSFDWTPIPAGGVRRNIIRALTKNRIAIAVMAIAVIAGGYGLVSILNPSARSESIIGAILPFEVLGTAEETGSLPLDIEHEIREVLEDIGVFMLISRTQVRAELEQTINPSALYATMDLHFLINSTISINGETVQFYPELIDASGNALWHPRYEFPQQDMKLHVDKFVWELVDELQQNLTEEEAQRLQESYSINPEAVRLCSIGQQLISQGEEQDYLAGIDSLELSIKLDSDYAEPFAAIADAYFWLMFNYSYSREETLTKSLEAAQESVRLKPSLVEGHMRLAGIQMWFEWNWEESDRLLKRTIALSPDNVPNNQAYAGFLVTQCRFEEAREQSTRILEIDPQWDRYFLAASYAFEEKYDRALSVIDEGQEYFPDRWKLAYLKTVCLIKKGRIEEAEEEFNRAVKDYPLRYNSIAMIYAMLGQDEKARDLMEQHELRSVLVLANLGENEAAIQQLQQALDEHNPNLCWLNAEKILYGELQNDPRFLAILEKLDFPD